MDNSDSEKKPRVLELEIKRPPRRRPQLESGAASAQDKKHLELEPAKAEQAGEEELDELVPEYMRREFYRSEEAPTVAPASIELPAEEVADLKVGPVEVAGPELDVDEEEDEWEDEYDEPELGDTIAVNPPPSQEELPAGEVAFRWQPLLGLLAFAFFVYFAADMWRQPPAEPALRDIPLQQVSGAKTPQLEETPVMAVEPTPGDTENLPPALPDPEPVESAASEPTDVQPEVPGETQPETAGEPAEVPSSPARPAPPPAQPEQPQVAQPWQVADDPEAPKVAQPWQVAEDPEAPQVSKPWRVAKDPKATRPKPASPAPAPIKQPANGKAGDYLIDEPEL